MLSSGEEEFLQIAGGERWGCGGGTVSGPGYLHKVGWRSCRPVVTWEVKGVVLF